MTFSVTQMRFAAWAVCTLRVSSRGKCTVPCSGKNKDTVNAEDDIREGVKRVGRFADYLVINLSSPNTKGLRTLQQREHLRSIITAAQNELEKLEERDRAQRERDGHSNPREEEEAASSDSVTHKAEQFFPTQTGKRPLLFVKIAVRVLTVIRKELSRVEGVEPIHYMRF